MSHDFFVTQPLLRVWSISQKSENKQLSFHNSTNKKAADLKNNNFSVIFFHPLNHLNHL